MRWLELTVEADVEAVEAVSEIFARLGRGSAVRPTRLVRDPDDELAVREDPTAPYAVTVHIPEDAESALAIDTIERALWHLQAFGLRSVGPLAVTPVEERDWMEAWKAGYTAQRIGRLVIVPSWLDEEPLGTDALSLRLDPGMAFGTGLHPTTRGCLVLLQEVTPMPARVLDVGCGSGILGLAALRLGARRVTAIDTDPLAVEATRGNAAINGLGEQMTVRRGTLPERPGELGRVPLIAANLVAALLVELAPRLAAHLVPNGVLLASGIIAPRASEVLDAFSAAGLAPLRRLDDGEWVSLRLQRSA